MTPQSRVHAAPCHVAPLHRHARPPRPPRHAAHPWPRSLSVDSRCTAPASAMTAASPHAFIGRHTARSFAQPSKNAAIAGTPPARRTTPKSIKLMIPNVGTNPPATQTPDEGR
ncbi:hypothetical protein ZWY2020_050096 [Hordeum vulgare]|nr:hypothetical protein ZWY2020_050096 [Hordeum vulgare]